MKENSKTIIAACVEGIIHDNGGIRAMQNATRDYRIFGAEVDAPVDTAVDYLAQILDAITDPNTNIEAEEAEFLKAKAEFLTAINKVSRSFFRLCTYSDMKFNLGDEYDTEDAFRHYEALNAQIAESIEDEKNSLSIIFRDISRRVAKGNIFTEQISGAFTRATALKTNEFGYAKHKEAFAKSVFQALAALGIELTKAE